MQPSFPNADHSGQEQDCLVQDYSISSANALEIP